jgi:hypothetical protein
VIPLVLLDTIDCCSSRDDKAGPEVAAFSEQESAELKPAPGHDLDPTHTR